MLRFKVDYTVSKFYQGSIEVEATDSEHAKEVVFESDVGDLMALTSGFPDVVDVMPDSAELVSGATYSPLKLV